jgi:hypothetical protein
MARMMLNEKSPPVAQSIRYLVPRIYSITANELSQKPNAVNRDKALLKKRI